MKLTNATSIGPRITSLEKQDQIAVKVYVEKKRKREDIPNNEPPREINGISTDVIERASGGRVHSGSNIPNIPHDTPVR